MSESVTGSTLASISGPDWLTVMADERAYAVMFTSRGCPGESAGPYDSFNICHYTGDAPCHVRLCREELSRWTGIGMDRCIIPRQTHSVRILTVDALPVKDVELEGVDGIVTSLTGVAIGVSTADCVPVILVDPEARIAGVAHAGWRGAVGGIVRNCVGTMITAGAAPDRMRAYIGPTICVDCFEVGEEVADRFPDECVVRFGDGRRPHVDLPGYVRLALLGAGLCPGNVSGFDPAFCTRCHPDRYFSARYSGVDSGRNFTFVVLKPGRSGD